jgi:hypothetical protein
LTRHPLSLSILRFPSLLTAAGVTRLDSPPPMSTAVFAFDSNPAIAKATRPLKVRKRPYTYSTRTGEGAIVRRNKEGKEKDALREHKQEC